MNINESQVRKMCDEAMLLLVDWRNIALKHTRDNHPSAKLYHKGREKAFADAIDSMAEVFGDLWPVDRCHYCGNVMDGDDCRYDDCPVNLEVSAMQHFGYGEAA